MFLERRIRRHQYIGALSEPPGLARVHVAHRGPFASAFGILTAFGKPYVWSFEAIVVATWGYSMNFLSQVTVL
jgi:hypothetical protein